MNMGKSVRLERIFNRNTGRSIIVPLDHGTTVGPIAGLVDMRSTVNKVAEGRPHIVDLIKNGEISYIVNTTEGRQAIADSFSIRREALQQRVTYSTTVSGANALLHSLDHRGAGNVLSLQELHRELTDMEQA